MKRERLNKSLSNNNNNKTNYRNFLYVYVCVRKKEQCLWQSIYAVKLSKEPAESKVESCEVKRVARKASSSFPNERKMEI